MSNWRFIIGFVCALVGGQMQLHAQNSLSREELMTAYLYNFMLYTEWPQLSVGDTIEVGLLDVPEAVQQSFVEIETQKWNDKAINVSFFGNEYIPVDKLNVLFFYNSARADYDALLAKVSGKPVLLIVNEALSGKYTMIAMSEKVPSATMGFELNIRNLSNSGLTVSPELVVLSGDKKDVSELYSDVSLQLDKQILKEMQLQHTIDSMYAILAIREQEITGRDIRMNIQYTELDSLYRFVDGQKNTIQQYINTVTGFEQKYKQKQQALDELVEEQLRLEKIIGNQRKQVVLQQEQITDQSFVLDEHKNKMSIQQKWFVMLVGMFFSMITVLVAWYFFRVQKRKSAAKLQQQKDYSFRQQAQIMQHTSHIDYQSAELQSVYANFGLLALLGKELAVAKTPNTMAALTLAHLSSLSIVPDSFELGIYNESRKTLDFTGSYKDNELQSPYYYSTNDLQRLPVWVFSKRIDFVLNDLHTDLLKVLEYGEVPALDSEMRSYCSLALIDNSDQCYGVLSIQSTVSNAFPEPVLILLKSIASYLTLSISSRFSGSSSHLVG